MNCVDGSAWKIFYRHSLPHATHMQTLLHEHLCDSRRKYKRKVEWNEISNQAFEKIKKDLTDVITIAYPCYALSQKTDKISARQQEQINIISQFINKIQYITDEENVVADALLRVNFIVLPTIITPDEIAKEQSIDDEIEINKKYQKSSLKI